MPYDDGDYAVDYRPRLTGWRGRIDDMDSAVGTDGQLFDIPAVIRPSTIKHAPLIQGRDYFTMTQGGALKCYGPFDNGREHNYSATVGVDTK